MNLHEMMDSYAEEGLTRALAASRVCQDIVLKALSEGPLSRNVTIKGGVVMRSLRARYICKASASTGAFFNADYTQFPLAWFVTYIST